MENENMNNTEIENDDVIVMDNDNVETGADSKLGIGAYMLLGGAIVAGGILLVKGAKKAWKKFKDKKEASKAEAESKTDDENENDNGSKG